MVWVRASCGFKESKIGAGCTGPLSRQSNEVNTPVRSRFDVPAALNGAGPELAQWLRYPAWLSCLARGAAAPDVFCTADCPGCPILRHRHRDSLRAFKPAAGSDLMHSRGGAA